MNEEWLSARLDGELSELEERELDAAIAADPALAAALDEVAGVRSVLRAAAVEPPAGALERAIAAVADADTDPGEHDSRADTVVSLAARKRIPRLAAVAASVVIIASVVGGLGGSATLPALGDLVAQHEAAAGIADGEPMPEEMADMVPMPMDDASTVAPPMPVDFTMEHAYEDDSTVHLVYRSVDGESVSVFRHAGETDVDDLGAGSIVEGDEAEMWSAPVAGNYVAVVDGTGFVWVMISDEPHDEMMDDMMHDLPTRTPSLAERFRDAADAVVEPFRLWD